MSTIRSDENRSFPTFCFFRPPHPSSRPHLPLGRRGVMPPRPARCAALCRPKYILNTWQRIAAFLAIALLGAALAVVLRVLFRSTEDRLIEEELDRAALRWSAAVEFSIESGNARTQLLYLFRCSTCVVVSPPTLLQPVG